MNQYVRIQNNEVIAEYPNGLPATVSWCKDRPYYRATHRHDDDGIRQAQFAVTPEGMVKAGSSWSEVDGVWVETGTYITHAEKDLLDYGDRWKAENDFLSYIQYLNATYNLNLTPNDGYQDVSAKLEASTTGTELERLKAGVKLGAAWDRCETHGSTWQNVEWHPEVVE